MYRYVTTNHIEIEFRKCYILSSAMTKKDVTGSLMFRYLVVFTYYKQWQRTKYKKKKKTASKITCIVPQCAVK